MTATITRDRIRLSNKEKMLRRNRECVINLPSVELVDEVIAIGNCSGDEVDKF
jgi:flavin reductase (DIM6/NTAB) family NADH-FMN oxidoreductase RutF